MGNKKQNMMIGYLCQRLGIDKETKEDMIYNHSNGRATSAADLYEEEARTLIAYLVDASGLPQAPAMKMKRKILSMAHELHWELPDGRVDMQRVNAWCIKYSSENKPLDEISTKNLSTLVTQFERVYTGFLKGI